MKKEIPIGTGTFDHPVDLEKLQKNLDNVVEVIKSIQRDIEKLANHEEIEHKSRLVGGVNGPGM